MEYRGGVREISLAIMDGVMSNSRPDSHHSNVDDESLPVSYGSGIVREHLHTRKSASLFDTCHMGEIRVWGNAAAAGLDRALARPSSSLGTGACRYNLLLTPQGGILDDLVVYRIEENGFLLVTNAATVHADLEQLRERLDEEIRVEDLSVETGKLDLQGPRSAGVLVELGMEPSSLPGYYRWVRVEWDGRELFISRTGYTGELGFELYPGGNWTEELWDRLMSHPDVRAAGLGARDTLRLEAGLPLYGQDITPDMTPTEAGLDGMIRRETGFVGAGFRRRRQRTRPIGLLLSGRQAARHGDGVFDARERRIGVVTSGSFAPSVGRAVAMAQVDMSASIGDGDDLRVGRSGRLLTAKTVGMPFYRDGTARIQWNPGGD